jgi:hypothetical protein
MEFYTQGQISPLRCWYPSPLNKEIQAQFSGNKLDKIYYICRNNEEGSHSLYMMPFATKNTVCTAYIIAKPFFLTHWTGEASLMKPGLTVTMINFGLIGLQSGFNGLFPLATGARWVCVL